MSSNKALIFKQIPKGYPVPGEDLTIQPALYDKDIAPVENGIVIQSLYASFDPYMRGRMRPADTTSYIPAFELDKPIESFGIAKVLRSNNAAYKEGDIVIGQIPIQEVISLNEGSIAKVRLLQNPLGIDLSVFLGALGETIFISAASGAVGQVVGQLAKHEGLKVIGSVGSDEKLDFILNVLGFDGGFNYKKETPASALARLAPQGLDIYYENVGGEHLEAAIDALNQFGRIVACGMISEYNSAPHPIKNLHKIVTKSLEMRGFIVANPGFADAYMEEHQKKVQKWISEGTFKALTHETVGIENAAEGLVGIFYGKNKGKAVLKF
ncbi:oxidoreductase, zinc-binding dehydrogenase family [Aspergillus nomiae NRRL 13137]|uniref:Oxidoreductase, zinc-binding dehydrogenase family n=1 Tax=Aspergillus nomiae NRRL (strain ATCC 15546 / NRRL 13137 / CBS 260.88 / M93) TaxID=1509407 RepID=A0A0L1IXF4_ASPN3|nr:oxidoreductase, zinc-binding dehydrogenase family [Aspergillus nomiae NRRL 13137]KNG84090.1 oxidoreductase, zinc-binding dehydrogenase family [Aspergillus nomiae NRRL 13137]